MERENDEWREPWDEKLIFLKGEKGKCSRCGKTMLMSESKLIASNTTFKVHGVLFTSEIRYCPDCYRKRKDKLTRIIELAGEKE